MRDVLVSETFFFGWYAWVQHSEYASAWLAISARIRMPEVAYRFRKPTLLDTCENHSSHFSSIVERKMASASTTSHICKHLAIIMRDDYSKFPTDVLGATFCSRLDPQFCVSQVTH